MKNNYLISVIIPTYNRGFIIQEALDSIFNQGISDLQVIVIDDGSTDNTKEVLAGYLEQITYVYQENQGQSVARNVGIELAQGTYICFLDSDDIFVEGAFKKKLALFEQYPEVETIISDAKFWLFNKATEESGLHPELKSCSKPTLLSEFPTYWHLGIIAATCCHIIKTEVLDSIKTPFFDPSISSWEDWDFFSKVYFHSTTLVFPEVTAYVRRFNDNTRKKRHIPGIKLTETQEVAMHKNRDIVAKKVAVLAIQNQEELSTTKTSFSDSYNQNGFYAPIQLLSPIELLYYRRSFQKLKKILGDNIKHTQMVQLHLHFSWAYKLVLHPLILEHLVPILGPNILVHGSTLFYKKPNNEKYVSWHQDGYFMKFSSPKYVTAWVAFEDSTPENGCLQVIPNSHHTVYKHESIPNKNTVLPSGLTIVENFDEQNAINLTLKAGEMSLHHVNIIHGSQANTSDKPRIGFAIRYIAAEVTQELYHHEVVLAKGEYHGNHYKLLSHPPENNDELSIANQKRAHEVYSLKRNACLLK